MVFRLSIFVIFKRVFHLECILYVFMVVFIFILMTLMFFNHRKCTGLNLCSKILKISSSGARAMSTHQHNLHQLPRIFVESLQAGQLHSDLSGDNLHYVLNVMRLKNGNRVRVFNENIGEWLAEIRTTGPRGKNASLLLDEQLREVQSDRKGLLPCSLLVAPIKKARFKLLIEKATELGVAHIIPIITQNTQHAVDSDSIEQFRNAAIQSAEQCERLTVPCIHDPITLQHLLDLSSGNPSADSAHNRLSTVSRMLDSTKPLLVCAERVRVAGETEESVQGQARSAADLQAQPLLSAVQHILRHPPAHHAAASSTQEPYFNILTGPEGGFTELELQKLSALPAASLVSLGPTILRAETAAVFALSTVSAAVCAKNYEEK